MASQQWAYPAQVETGLATHTGKDAVHDGDDRNGDAGGDQAMHDGNRFRS